MTSIHTHLALVASSQWSLNHIDVKSAFLNGDLFEVIYMQPSSSIIALPGHVCKLRRALYSLKQAPRAWYERFQQSLLSVGYTQNMVDYEMF